MSDDELRWAHMTAEELVNELTLKDNLTGLETILVSKLAEVLDATADDGR